MSPLPTFHLSPLPTFHRADVLQQASPTSVRRSCRPLDECRLSGRPTLDRNDSYGSTRADWLADLSGPKQSSESSGIEADPR